MPAVSDRWHSELAASRSQPDGTAGVALEVFVDLSAAEERWRGFEQVAERTVFQNFDWLSEWHRHIGWRRNAQPVIVAATTAGGRPLMLLPLAIERRSTVRRLTWLGSDLCDYNAPLLAADFVEHVPSGQFRALWRRILGMLRIDPRLRFDLVDMEKLPERIGSQPNPFLALPVGPAGYSAHLATLADAWEAFYASRRSPKSRKADRRQLLYLARRGEIRFSNDIRNPHDIGRTLDILIAQKKTSFVRMRAEDIFARGGYPEFYHAVAVSPRLSDVVHVSRVDVGDMTVAAGLGLKSREQYHLLLTSYQGGDVAKSSPGRAHIHELLRYAIGQRMKRFDFTIGDEPYKRDWCDVELKLFAYIEAATLKGQAVAALAKTGSGIARLVRRVPPLRRAAARARTAASGLRHRRSGAAAPPDQ